MTTSFFFDVCAFVIFTMLICADYLKKTYIGRSNSIFFLVLIELFLTSIAKLSFQIILQKCEYSILARDIAYFFIYLKFVLLIFVIYTTVFYIFTLSGLWNVIKHNVFCKKMMISTQSLPFLCLIYNVFTKKLFYISGGMQYFTNPEITVILLAVFVNLFVCTVIFLKNIKIIQVSKIIIPSVLLFVNIIVEHFQTVFSFLPQFSTFLMGISCYLILLFTKRPELLVNSSVNAKTARSFFDECYRFYNYNIQGNVALIKIINSKNFSVYVGEENYSEFLKKVASSIKNDIQELNADIDLHYLKNSLFALICQNQKNELNSVANVISKKLSKKIIFKGFEFFPQISICLVDLPEDVQDLESFYYFALNFQSIIGQTAEPFNIKKIVNSTEFKIKNSLSNIIKKAFENDSFEVFFQPIWNVSKKKFSCAEALVRLNDPSYGYIPPSLFIPAAERHNLIHKIGYFVLEEVCKFISSKEFVHSGLEFIEVNLSTSQCIESDFVDNILKFINIYGVPASKLRFEIVESSADFNPTTFEKNINALHDFGFKIALDDYGTGYSNINKVLKLPLDVIKLDKVFVDELDNPQMWTVIRDTIQMMKKLDKEVFIEGIDKESSAKCFENLIVDGIENKFGVDYIQGYYYSSPLPKNEFLKFLKRRNS